MANGESKVWWALSFVAVSAVGCADRDPLDDASSSTAAAVESRGTSAPQAHGGHGQRPHHGHVPPGHSHDADAATPEDAGSTDAGERPAFLRVALMGTFSPFDLCLRPRGAAEDGTVGEFVGPVLRSHGLPGGLLLEEVSSYFPVAPGAYDLRGVAGGSLDCATQLNPSALAALSDLSAGEYRTIVVVGSPAKLLFRFFDLLDEPSGPTRVRLLNTGLPSPNVSIGLGTGESFVPWISSVPSVSVGAPPQTDANGYVAVSPLSGQTVTLRVGASGQEVVHVRDFDLGDGDAVTFFSRQAPGGALGFQLITCFDLDDSSAPLATCSVASE